MGEDAAIPLSEPVQTASGKMQDSVLLPKGTKVIIPVQYFNRCEAIWGPDAMQFVPERWLKEKTDDSGNEGSKHLYTFSDGPRMCIGKVFAIAEMKVCIVNRVKRQWAVGMTLIQGGALGSCP